MSEIRTKFMAMLPDGQWQASVSIQLHGNNDPMKPVSSFPYIDSVLTDACSLGAEVSACISRAYISAPRFTCCDIRR